MSIPDANGELHAVYDANPDPHGSVLSIIDPATGSPRSGQSEVTWNVQGPPGPAGSQGPAGPEGLQGPAGTPGTVISSGPTVNADFDDVGTLQVDPGTIYTVIGPVTFLPVGGTFIETATALIRPGDRILSGGWKLETVQDVMVYQSYPTTGTVDGQTADGWAVTARNLNPDNTIWFTAYAVAIAL